MRFHFGLVPVLVSLLSAVAFSGCASAPSAEAAKEASRVRALPPASCRLAVALSKAPSGQPTNSESLQFTFAGTQWRDAVVAQLASLNSASEVIAVDNAEDARRKQADLFLDLSVSQGAPLAHKGLSSGWWSSGLLWAVTWIGGLLTDDSTYDTNVRLAAKFSRAAKDSRQFTEANTESEAVDLNYWERNKLMSWRFLQSLVLPPFWTSDDAAITSATLTERGVETACVRLASFIKTDIENRSFEDLASFTLVEPTANGATVGGDAATLRFQIRSKSGVVESITVQVNQASPVPIPTPARITGTENQWNVGVPIQRLVSGRNEVRIRVQFGDDVLARTIVLWRR